MTSEEVFAECVNNVIRRAMAANSEDNLTCIIVFFKNYLV
jgi:serine/threonine protein phosphatase PrpC